MTKAQQKRSDMLIILLDKIKFNKDCDLVLYKTSSAWQLRIVLDNKVVGVIVVKDNEYRLLNAYSTIVFSTTNADPMAKEINITLNNLSGNAG